MYTTLALPGATWVVPASSSTWLCWGIPRAANHATLLGNGKTRT